MSPRNAGGAPLERPAATPSSPRTIPERTAGTLAYDWIADAYRRVAERCSDREHADWLRRWARELDVQQARASAEADRRAA